MSDRNPSTKGRTASNRWATSAKNDSLLDLRLGLPVRLIATDRASFITCEKNDLITDVRERHGDKFDHLPVVASIGKDRGRIVGLLDLVDLRPSKSLDTDRVKNSMRSITEGDLIGADAGILDFIRQADTSRFRFLVMGSEIFGLVSLSDLQRLPVRAALFGVITHLEMVMPEAIRVEYGGFNDWSVLFDSKRRDHLGKLIARAHLQDNFVDDLSVTSFGDKVNIVGNLSGLSKNRETMLSELKSAEDLRNQLAHAKHYASSQKDAAKVCQLVRRIEHWIDTFSSRRDRDASFR